MLAAGVLLWPRLPRVASNALNEPGQYEVLSLEPSPPSPPSPDLFHGYRILGTTVVGDETTRRRLNDALRGGVRWVLADRPRCFTPRHGVRIVRGLESTDFVICFECAQVQMWRGAQKLADWPTDSSPQVIFDDVLRKASVPLATPAE
jgi:hypothetical protein